MEIDEMIADARSEEKTRKDIELVREYARQYAKNANMVTIDLEEYMYLRSNNERYCMLMDEIGKSLRITWDKKNLALGENNIVDILRLFYPDTYARKLKALQEKEGDEE